jgi:hypothetical protein
MHFGRLVRGSATLLALAGTMAACSTPPRSDAGVEDVRNLRDGSVTLPSFYDATPDSGVVLDSGVVEDTGVPLDTGVSPLDAGRDASDAAVDVPTPPATTNVRFVYALPPGTPPSVDICVRRTGTMDFAGPLVRAARGGMGNGLDLLQVTRYFAVPTGTIDVVLVAGSAMDCSTPVLPPMGGLNVGAANGHRTVVISGIPAPGPDGGPQPFPFAGRVITDVAPNSVGAGATALRAVHAIPSTTRLDLGIVLTPGGSAIDVVLFSAVGFGEVGGPPGMGDAGAGMYPNGYYSSVPIAAPGVTVGLRANCGGTGCGPLTSVMGIVTTERSITSMFLGLQLRVIMGTPTPVPVAVRCNDHVAPSNGLSDCAALPM